MVAAIQARTFAALVASFCVLGLCIAFAQPLFSLPDEPAHWLSANVRLERLFGREGCVPSLQGYACPQNKPCSSIPELRLTCGNDIGLYGDVLTYPGVLLGKLVLPRQTESAIRQVQSLLLSRLLQGLLVVLCLARVGVLARKTGRLGSLTLAAFMLSPLLAQQAFAVSSDGAQLGFGLFLFACVMYWEALTRADAVAFLLLGYAAAAKPTVLPVVLPAVLAGYWFAQLSRPERSSLRELARGLVQLLKFNRDPSPQTLIAWGAIVLSGLTVVLSLAHDSAATAAVAAEDQVGRIGHLQRLRERPGLIFELVGQLDIRFSWAKYWTGPLGWLDVRLSPAVIHGFRNTFWSVFGVELLALAALAVRERETLAGAGGRCLRALPPLLMGLLAIAANVLFITAVMYVLWTPLGARISGIQIRYFFPATMVLIALVFRALQSIAPRERDPEFPPRTRWLSVAAPCLVLAVTLPFVARLYVDLALRYHDPSLSGTGL